jgi:hypothetical protein
MDDAKKFQCLFSIYQKPMWEDLFRKWNSHEGIKSYVIKEKGPICCFHGSWYFTSKQKFNNIFWKLYTTNNSPTKLVK